MVPKQLDQIHADERNFDLNGVARHARVIE
jgi:hypothetical protein